MNIEAAKKIILAQIASDGGKHIRSPLIEQATQLVGRRAERVWQGGYKHKDQLLAEACQLIASRPDDKDIRFFVVEDEDRVADYIIYFDIKISGKRWQASFHSYNYRWYRWLRGSRYSIGHWDHRDSRASCSKLCGSLLESLTK